MAHNVWDLEAEQIGQAPGGEWLCPLPSALCPLSLLRTTAALPAAALPARCSVVTGLFLFPSLFLFKPLFLVLLTGSICVPSRPSWITCQDATRTPTGIPGW